MNISKTSAASEGGNWYRRTETGVEQIDEVVGANGNIRKPTLRDARADGSWMPGSTTVVRQAHAEGLIRYQISENVRAAVELGGPRIRVDDGFCYTEEWPQFLKVCRQKAEESSQVARDVGSMAHLMVNLRFTDPEQERKLCEDSYEHEQAAGMAQAIMGAIRELCEDWDTRIDCINEANTRLDEDGKPMPPSEAIPYERMMPEWWQALDQEQRELSYFGGDMMFHGGEGQPINWKSEDPVCHPSGFATKADLWTANGCGWLFDFKGKKTHEDLTLKTYEQHHMQLAATREAIRYTHGVDIPSTNCRIVYFTRQKKFDIWGAKVADPTPDKIERGWQMFQGLLAYYQAKTNHFPGWQE